MKLLLRLGTGKPGAGYGLVVETYKQNRVLDFDNEVEIVSQRYDGVEGFKLEKGQRFPLSQLVRMMVEESSKFPDSVSGFKIDWIGRKEEAHILRMFGED